jgi:hypothetical protein
LGNVLSYQNSNGKKRVSIILFIATCIMIILCFTLPKILRLDFLYGEFIGLELLFVGFLIILFLYVLIRFISPKSFTVKPRFINSLLNLLEIRDFGSLDPKSICVMCLNNFHIDEKVVACPNCYCHFHRDHLRTRLEDSFECPICRFDFGLIINNDMIENS